MLVEMRAKRISCVHHIALDSIGLAEVSQFEFSISEGGQIVNVSKWLQLQIFNDFYTSTYIKPL